MWSLFISNTWHLQVSPDYELAPHLAEKPLPPGKPQPVNPREAEIDRLQVVDEKINIIGSTLAVPKGTKVGRSL